MKHISLGGLDVSRIGLGTMAMSGYYLDPSSSDGARNFARDKAMERFAYLNTQLEGREYLLDRFTVADAYLVTVLNWARFSGLDLAQFPAVDGYFSRLSERPSVARALAEEFALYKEQQARRAA